MYNMVFIALGVGAVVVVFYVLVMRVFFRDSRELDKGIDLAKMKKWKDED